jgi:hypothetical protein
VKNTRIASLFIDKIKLYFSLIVSCIVITLSFAGIIHFAYQSVSDEYQLSFLFMVLSIGMLCIGGSSFWKCAQEISGHRVARQALIQRRPVSLRFGIF